MYMRNKQYKYVLGSRIYLLASKQILQQKLLNDYNVFFENKWCSFQITYLMTNQSFFFNFQTQYFPDKILAYTSIRILPNMSLKKPKSFFLKGINN